MAHLPQSSFRLGVDRGDVAVSIVDQHVPALLRALVLEDVAGVLRIAGRPREPVAHHPVGTAHESEDVDIRIVRARRPLVLHHVTQRTTAPLPGVPSPDVHPSHQQLVRAHLACQACVHALDELARIEVEPWRWIRVGNGARRHRDPSGDGKADQDGPRVA